MSVRTLSLLPINNARCGIIRLPLWQTIRKIG
jgi:hypothetical protein